MPITRKQFELGIDSEIAEWMKKIHSYLEFHKDEAFTKAELEGFLGISDTGDFGAYIKQVRVFTEALDKLVEVGAAAKRIIQDKTYYSLGDLPLPI